MKVAILTTFADLDRSYSLVGVALEQAAMLKEHGIDFDFVVLEPKACNADSMASEPWLTPHIRKELPSARLEEDILNADLVTRTREWLRANLASWDVVIAHDLMFLTWNVSYNRAIRDVMEDFPGTTWLHWVHSAPGGRPNRLVPGSATELRYTPAPFSIYVYLNEEDRVRYAESLGLNIGQVFACYNPLDGATFLGADGKLSDFIRKHHLWDYDLMQVYPFSMPRHEAKGVNHLLGIFGGFKNLGYKVKLVLVNAHANAPAEKAMVRALADEANRKHGLGAEELVWTSLEEGWDYSVPHAAVKRLLMLSNIFIFPTKSEACSRVLQEASLAGCLVVGNSTFKPMREFLHPSIRTFEFGSLTDNVNHPLGMDGGYQREIAKALNPLLQHPMMKQKSFMLRLAARDTIWREQFQPLLERAKQMSQGRAK